MGAGLGRERAGVHPAICSAGAQVRERGLRLRSVSLDDATARRRARHQALGHHRTFFVIGVFEFPQRSRPAAFERFSQE